MDMPVFNGKSWGAIGLLLCSTLAAPALAQAPQQPAPVPEPTIRIDLAACQWVTRHHPSADVDYQPGVDVNGDPVAPADLPGNGGIDLPKDINIAITVNTAKRLGIPANDLYKGEVQVGMVTLRGNQVLFNGKPIQPDAEQELLVLCRKKGE
jgi:hypothetical protein